MSPFQFCDGLIGLGEGWEALTAPAPLPAAALSALAEARGTAFAGLAEVVGAPQDRDEARRLVGGTGQRFVDFGAEEYTRGRPHPIIDPSRRHAAILEAADEPGVGVLLLDLVLGDCAHPDPAGALDPVLAEAYERARRGSRELTVVAHVVGTDEDAQDLARQQDTLRNRGVIVCASNRIAAETARALAGGGHGA